MLATRFTFERIVRFQVFTGGFWRSRNRAGAVFGFVLFGRFCRYRRGKFLIILSFAAAGRYRGRPAKASVIASAAMGSISGMRLPSC